MSSKASPYIPGCALGTPIAAPVMTATLMPNHNDAAYHIDAFMCSQVGGVAMPSWHSTSGNAEGAGTDHAFRPLEPSTSVSSGSSGALLNPEAQQQLLDPVAVLATMGGMQQLQSLQLRHSPPVPTHWAACGEPSPAMSAGLLLAAEFPAVMSAASAVPRMVPMAPAPTVMDLPKKMPSQHAQGSKLVQLTANMSPHIRPNVGVSGVGAPPILAVGPPVMPLSTVPSQSRATPSVPSNLSHMPERPSMPSAHSPFPDRPSVPSAQSQIPERSSKPFTLNQNPERPSMPSAVSHTPERPSVPSTLSQIPERSSMPSQISQIPERPSIQSHVSQNPVRPTMHPPLSQIPERPSAPGQSQPLRLVSSLALETPAHDQTRRRLKNKPLQAQPGNMRNTSSLSFEQAAESSLSPSIPSLQQATVPIRRLENQRLELTSPPSRAAPELPTTDQTSPGGASASDMLFQ